MALEDSIRLTVFLPCRTPGQLAAASLARRWLHQNYPNGTVFGSEMPSSPVVPDLGNDALPLQPLVHGVWHHPDTGAPEWDSHVLFMTHTHSVAHPDEQLEQLEVALYAMYYAEARRLREPLTYQHLVFVEAWRGWWVHQPQRLSLKSTLVRQE